MKLSQKQAEAIAANYQFLKGKFFVHPMYGRCEVDFITPLKQVDGSFTVVMGTDIKKSPNIPELYGFQTPLYDLFLFLKINGVPYKPKKYGILTDDAV